MSEYTVRMLEVAGSGEVIPQDVTFNFGERKANQGDECMVCFAETYNEDYSISHVVTYSIDGIFNAALRNRVQLDRGVALSWYAREYRRNFAQLRSEHNPVIILGSSDGERLEGKEDRTPVQKIARHLEDQALALTGLHVEKGDVWPPLDLGFDLDALLPLVPEMQREKAEAALQKIRQVNKPKIQFGSRQHRAAFIDRALTECLLALNGIYSLLDPTPQTPQVEPPPMDNSRVFIVHGHDDTSKLELKDFLKGLGLEPIILHQQDDLGKTIIGKFEHYAATCSFAFVLLTPDDKPPGEETEEAQWRARQNVILELGWFMGKIGRERVAVLHKIEVEIPSDMFGVLYLPFEKTVMEVSEKIRQRLQGQGFQI